MKAVVTALALGAAIGLVMGRTYSVRRERQEIEAAMLAMLQNGEWFHLVATDPHPDCECLYTWKGLQIGTQGVNNN